MNSSSILHFSAPVAAQYRRPTTWVSSARAVCVILVPSEVVDEIEVLYEDVPNKKERLEQMNVIGARGLYFPEDDDSDGSDEFEALDKGDG